MRRSVTARRVVMVLLLVVPLTGVVTGLWTHAGLTGTPAHAVENGLAQRPYLGWSSWSLQSSTRSGLNPHGKWSWLEEANVLKQVDVVAAKLKPHGYQYVNMDAGWWQDWSWKPGYDQYGRPTPDKVRFPHGIRYVNDYIHSKGLKAGIYLPAGLEKESYDKGDLPISGAPGCRTHDVVYDDLRTTNGWDSAYKFDFAKPCAQRYIDSIATMFAGWGVDFFKLDGVGPGSGKGGPNHDNRDEVAAYSKALIATGRPIHFELSWSLDINAVAAWQRYANGWRIDTDVECYCDTLVTWDRSVKQRFSDVVPWIQHAGPGGWNDLDAVDVGVGAMDGLSADERQSVMTLWSVSAAPLFSGDDLTRLDPYGLSLLTNDEVLAIDQQGRPARPVSPNANQQVWWARNTDGSYTVALFNLEAGTRTATARWSDLGFSGPANVRDVWRHQELGSFGGSFAASLPAHGSRLLRVVPAPSTGTIAEAEAPGNALTGTARIASCPACSGGAAVGYLGNGATLGINGVTVAKAGTYTLTIAYLSGDARNLDVSIDGGPPQHLTGLKTADWSTVGTTTLTVALKAGANTVLFGLASAWAPDIDRITVTASP